MNYFTKAIFIIPSWICLNALNFLVVIDWYGAPRLEKQRNMEVYVGLTSRSDNLGFYWSHVWFTEQRACERVVLLVLILFILAGLLITTNNGGPIWKRDTWNNDSVTVLTNKGYYVCWVVRIGVPWVWPIICFWIAWSKPLTLFIIFEVNPTLEFINLLIACPVNYDHNYFIHAYPMNFAHTYIQTLL